MSDQLPKHGNVDFSVLQFMFLLNPVKVRCSSDLAELASHSFSQVRSICYSDSLHYLTIPSIVKASTPTVFFQFFNSYTLEFFPSTMFFFGL